MAVADGLPRILYTNLFESATTVVASTEAVGFEGANAYDWKMSTFWMPTASGSTLTATFPSPVTADAFGIVAHTLGTTSATLFLEHDDTGFVTDLTLTPSSDITVTETFASAASTIWRIRVTYAGDDPIIGVASFGEFFEFERGLTAGYSSPNLSDVPKVLNAVTQGGNFIGRTLLSNENKASLSVSNMTIAYAIATWEPFVQHAQFKGFFLLWNERDFPAEAAYCWTNATPPARKYSQNGFVSNNIAINQRTE